LGASETSGKTSQMLAEVLNFVENSSGLTSQVSDNGSVSIHQAVDGKTFRFKTEELGEILQRMDSDGKNFIQVNFSSGNKVLLTDTLVGFKPRETLGLDMSKIPRVVTTPDLISVFEAIEDSLGSDSIPETELDILKKVFSAILQGGESAGFDLTFERKWLARLVSMRFQASA
jgi:hypothetical protein